MHDVGTGVAGGRSPSIVRGFLCLVYVIVAVSNLAFVLTHWAFPIWRLNWGVWIDLFHEKGLVGGYYAAKDVYPPLTFSLLAGLAKLPGDTYINFKLAQLFCLFASALIVLLWKRDGGLAVAIVLALTANSVVFESIDIFFTPMLIGALIAAVHRRWAIFSCLYTAALLVKYQPIVIAPFVFIWLLPDLRIRRTWIELAVPALVVLTPVVAVFGPAFILTLTRAVQAGQYFSGDAFNVNWLAGSLYAVIADSHTRLDPVLNLMSPSVIPPWMWATAKTLSVLCYAALIALCALSRREPRTLFLFCGLGMLSYCMLHTEVHENHLHVAVVCFALLAAVSKADLPTFVFWSGAQAVNLMFLLTGWPRALFGLEWTLLIALGNTAMFAVLYRDTARTALEGRRWRWSAPPPAPGDGSLAETP